jgi:hypothetical protein
MAPSARIVARGSYGTLALAALGFATLLGTSLPAQAQSFRSSLYPTNWTPGYKDAQGRFLHDFGYAGYERGEKPIPNGPPNGATLIRNVVTDYAADNTGVADVTTKIQQALDDVGVAGGGIVYLPAGTYKIQPQGSNTYALRVKYSNVVLRGAGTGQTYLYNVATVMRNKHIIQVYPNAGGSWLTDIGTANANLTQDITDPTRELHVDDVAGFAVGDWVVVRANATNDFIADHQMTGWWNTSQSGPTFYRKIIAVDGTSNTLTIDAPTRYWLKQRDSARVYKVAASITGVGLEDFSIGNNQNLTPGFGDTDFNTTGTGAYEVHNSYAVTVQHALNCWVQRVNTYRPSGNTNDYHILSNGLNVARSRSVTVQNCVFSNTQYEGEGGNGYAFNIQGNECLFKELTANDTRHNYDFKFMYSSGNVLLRCTSNTPRLPSDFHMYLSMSNLFDCTTMNKDFIEAVVRPYGSGTALHGVTSSQSVFWNTTGVAYPTGKSYIIDSRQLGWGYIIGTQGAASAVRTTPTVMTFTGMPTASVDTSATDFTEGIGNGANLLPVSLSEDQRARRDVKYNVSADAYIRGGTAYASTNFGTATSMMVKDAPNTDNSFDRIVFLKASYTGYAEKAANRAQLFFYVSGVETAGTPVPIKVYGYANDSWTETGITWNAQPSSSGSTLLGQVTVTGAGWYSLDVTNYVNTQMIDKTVTFKLANETTVNSFINIPGREAGSNTAYVLVTR